MPLAVSAGVFLFVFFLSFSLFLFQCNSRNQQRSSPSTKKKKIPSGPDCASALNMSVKARNHTRDAPSKHAPCDLNISNFKVKWDAMRDRAQRPLPASEMEVGALWDQRRKQTKTKKKSQTQTWKRHFDVQVSFVKTTPAFENQCGNNSPVIPPSCGSLVILPCWRVKWKTSQRLERGIVKTSDYASIDSSVSTAAET